jgi:hypothetical protein
MLTPRIFYGGITLSDLSYLYRAIESPMAFSFALVIEMYYFSALSLLLFIKNSFL